ncbi:COP9 signalosome [Gorgonomyces haynaldii]|nr:COP9 signalosome [Gorgonomyces haynaldii]
MQPLLEQLRKEFPKDLTKAGQTLDKIKTLFPTTSFLVEKDPKQLILTREVLEYLCLYAVHTKDVVGFERYYVQLKQYLSVQPASPRQMMLVGLNLVHLLSQNRIAEFHTELESISPEQFQNVYIKHPIQIEQSLMEGSYNKVWNTRQSVPAEEYKFFVDILIHTIRNEIASCAEKAYNSIPVQDAITLLYFKNMNELVEFCKTRQWAIGDKIVFKQNEQEKAQIPADDIVKISLKYAQELEQIV